MLRKLFGSVGLILVAITSPAFADVITVGTNQSVTGLNFGANTDIGLNDDFFVAQFNPALGTLTQVEVRWFSTYTFHGRISGTGTWTVDDLEYVARTEVYGPGPTAPGATGAPGQDGLRFPHVFGGASASGTGPLGDYAPDSLIGGHFHGDISGPGSFSEDFTVVEGSVTGRPDIIGPPARDLPDANGDFETSNPPRTSFILNSNFGEYVGTGSVFFDANIAASFRGTFTDTTTTGSTWDSNFRVEVIYTYTPVPEPSTYAMLAVLGVLGGAFAWRSRQVQKNKR